MTQRRRTIKMIVQSRFLPSFFYDLQEAKVYFAKYAKKPLPFFIYLVESGGSKPVYSVIDSDLYNCMSEDPEAENMKVLAFG